MKVFEANRTIGIHKETKRANPPSKTSRASSSMKIKKQRDPFPDSSSDSDYSVDASMEEESPDEERQEEIEETSQGDG